MSDNVDVPILLSEGARCPYYATQGAAGADLCAFLKEDLVIPPGKSALVPTGVRVAIPQGYELQVRPRSGLALKHQISVLNTPGTIDSDYRGEIGVILINFSDREFIVKNGERIAQLVLAPVATAAYVLENELATSTTSRGEGGFGHTGK